MNASRRVITGITLVIGAAAIWHLSAVVHTTNDATVEHAHLASNQATRDASPNTNRTDHPTRQPGVIDRHLLRQHEAGRLSGSARRAIRDMSPELIDSALEVAEQIDPEMASELRHLCSDDPSEFQHLMQTSGRRLVALAELKANDPSLYDLKIDELHNEAQIAHTTDALRDAMREGDQERISTLREELRGLVTHQIALSFRSRGDYLARVREYADRLKEELDRDAARFGELIQERLDEIIQQARADAQQRNDPNAIDATMRRP